MSAQSLVESVVARHPLREIVSDPATCADIERTLAPLHAAHARDVVWVAINESRVDALVRGPSGEWRLVLGTADGERIDWLHVDAEPPRFDGIAGGRAVVVNGPSGAGKSTVMAAVQELSPLPWIVFDEPTMGSVAQGYLIWRDRSEVIHRGFLDGIAAIARAGNCVATSAAGRPQAWFDAAFDGIPLLRLGLDCDHGTLLRRERGREGRRGGLATASLDDHRGWDYHARFDTTALSPTAIAERILALVG